MPSDAPSTCSSGSCGSRGGDLLGMVLREAGLLTLAAVAMLATWLPARRAAKVDPMIALRAD